MPYITSQEVKEMRDELKKAFPDFKLSVTRRHHSTVCVTILKGNVDFGGDNMQINHFYYRENFAAKPEAVAVFDKILSIIRGKKAHEIVSHDTDYGDWPNYYVDLAVGDYEKKYQKVA